MLIKTSQLDSIAISMEEFANAKLVVYSKQRFPNMPVVTMFTIDDVRKVRDAAKQYKIFKENDVATFLDFSIMFGNDFHTDSWAHPTLICKALHGPDKMALLRHMVRQSGIIL